MVNFQKCNVIGTEEQNQFSGYFPKNTLTQRPLSRIDLNIGLRKLIDYIAKKYGTNLHMLEIGSYIGESTIEFAKVFNSIITIDPYKNGYDDSDGASYQSDMNDVYNNFKFITRNFKNITHYTETSQSYYDSIKDFPKELKTFDFVYVDGLHTYEGVKLDLSLWWDNCKYLIAGHDINFEGVRLAVHEFITYHENEIENVIIFDDSSWILEKK